MELTLSENILQRPLDMLLLDQAGPAWGSVVMDWGRCAGTPGPLVVKTSPGDTLAPAWPELPPTRGSLG